MHRRFALSLALLVLSVLPFSGAPEASAHSRVPIKMLCGDMTRPPTIVQSFEFNGTQLRALVDMTLASLESNTLSASDKCGIVDAQLELELQLESDFLSASTLRKADEWTQTTMALAMLCSHFELDGVAPSAYVIDGTSGYHASNHHTTYRIANGVKGVCAICPPADAWPGN